MRSTLVPWLESWVLRIAGIILFTYGAQAQYHSYNIQAGSDCIVQDYRSPAYNTGIYDAIHEETVTSSDGGSGYFYGGMTQHNGADGTFIQYVCWPASGGFAPYSQQIPVFAGTNMTWWPQIGEGSSCAIKGFWPQFTTNLWSRFVVRYWQPAAGTSHLGYQGMWMKEPVSGNWYHLGTFLYPFAVTGVNGMSGWQENFSGYTGIYTVDHAGGYYHKGGVWRKANQVSFTASGHVSVIENGTAVRSEVGNSALANNVPATLKMTNQPALPTFDPIVVTDAAASTMGNQLLVRWTVPPWSSPQLEYRVEVFNNTSLTGTPAVNYLEREPETRQKLLNISGIATPYVRLTISDIFFNTNNPILLTPQTSNPNPATGVSETSDGLSYQYYEAASGNWTSLPDFQALSPVLTGAVGYPDLSPRKRRTNYGFNYSGYLMAPTSGLYAFTLHSGDGSRLLIDGTTVIDFDGLHDSSQFKGGATALAAGQHAFQLQFFKGEANHANSSAYTDELGLAWEGPGFDKADIPASAFFRIPSASEPTIALTGLSNGDSIPNDAPGLIATVTNNGASLNRVQFYLTDYYSYYPHPTRGADYFIGEDSAAPFNLNRMIWTAPNNAIRARVIYNNNRTIDSGPIAVATTNQSLGSWFWSPLEMHNHPSGVSVEEETLELLGDGMNLVTRKVIGDCTLIAHLVGMTPNVPGPDGVSPGGDWRAGIILRGTTNTTIGQPLGDGSTTRFAALFSTVNGGTYFQDDTMRAGNGDANRWSADLGGGNRWYKLQRTSNTFTSFVSADRVTWSQVNSVTLPSFGSNFYAGVFLYAGQSRNPNLHSASFDGFNLTGPNILGPHTLSISPRTNPAVKGTTASFAVSVIGPPPTGFQWQLNGKDIPNATNSTYAIASVTATDTGNYTVSADGTTSTPAVLVLSVPSGSGIWTHPTDGSWAASGNWKDGLIASGIDAIADFSTLNLAASPTISLNGGRTVGNLIFADQNPLSTHGWNIIPGAGGNLTLSTSAGKPSLAVSTGTTTIQAILAGNQGFTKSGAGNLVLSGAGTITGTISVAGGTLEVQNKKGDTAYSIAQGATLRFGYSTGGGYANTGMTINGDGANAATGFYLQGGKTYNASGQITLLNAPTTLRQFGSGLASLGTFDINLNGLWCTAAASGSASDKNIQIVSTGYGMSMKIDRGANTANGDFTIEGPLNISGLADVGFNKRGQGSLFLGSTATTDTVFQLEEGSVICGANNCLGSNTQLKLAVGTSLLLNGFNQRIGSLTTVPGSQIDLSSANTLSVATAPVLAGNLNIQITRARSPSSSALQFSAGILPLGGNLTVSSSDAANFEVGDVFQLFTARGYTGNFGTVTLPVLPAYLFWNTQSLYTSGTIKVATNPDWPTILEPFRIDGGNFAIRFTGTSGHHYQVLFSPTLAPGIEWQIATNIPALTGNPIEFPVIPLSSTGFYRPILVP